MVELVLLVEEWVKEHAINYASVLSKIFPVFLTVLKKSQIAEKQMMEALQELKCKIGTVASYFWCCISQQHWQNDKEDTI